MIYSINIVSAVIVVVFALSLIGGFAKGATGSAKHLFSFVLEGCLTALGLFVAWKVSHVASSVVHDFLVSLDIRIPVSEIGPFKQTYYTIITGIRDFPLLRFAILFVVFYMIVKYILYRIWFALSFVLPLGTGKREAKGAYSIISGTAGGAIGIVHGAARSLIIVAALFVYATLMPSSAITKYIQASSVYQFGAQQVIQPITGDYLAEKLPVFTRAVSEQFTQILQRKYEIIDSNIPQGIALAAEQITAEADTDEAKAKALYSWVGKRIAYDFEKVRLYEEEDIWMEQTPNMTFETRKGVCIDYARLYAVMARSVGLQVTVVTGLGYDGRGSYGPHAWNEVYLSDSDTWVPLDATWASSGGNWFDPPDFDQTHIKNATV